MAGLTALLIGSLLVSGVNAPIAPSYVALGDSYAAGVGTPDSTGYCGQSPQSYPSLYARQQHFPDAHIEACSGASTDDVVADQLDDLNAGVSLVTITVGGTDVGFSDVMTTCVLGGDSACVDKVHHAEDLVNGELGGKLAATFQAIKAKAPNAKLVVLGYPHVVEDGGACSLSEPKRRALNEGSDQLAAVTADQAAKAGAVFADARPAFAGHGYCSRDAWINGVTFPDTDGSFHPNTDGQRDGYLALLSAAAG
jgi:lysophospholipase L1-like esterase